MKKSFLENYGNPLLGRDPQFGKRWPIGPSHMYTATDTWTFVV